MHKSVFNFYKLISFVNYHIKIKKLKNLKKNVLLLVILCLSIAVKSQENNSLLWEISGNGLQKKSYLYGTMHVSQKIAFHLDDVFYESLFKSDFIGLESDPNLWLDDMFQSDDLMGGLGNFNSPTNNFYTNSFKPYSPKIQELMFYIAGEVYLMNSLLYRTDAYMQNYQEDTYLDMFVFQAAKKFGKKVFSLEDLKRSKNLVEKAQVNPTKEKPDLWLQKKLKKEDYFSLLSNSYRNRNIHLIDSLNEGMYTKNYLTNMLYIRNKEMVMNIDSIVKEGSLFSAVGAAHLGGEKGVVNLLRKKGYKVVPLKSKKTQKAEDLKLKIEEKSLNPVFKEDKSSDSFFTAKFPNKLYELNILDNAMYLSPDLVNGSYVVVSRINTFSSLKKDSKIKDEFNKLLFEGVPGKIISKKEIENQGIKGLDILNKTKSGDFQRYHVYFTPLEVLIFKMTGKKDFVNKYGDTFFNSIQLKKSAFNLVNVSPKHGGFSVKLPDTYIFRNKENIGNRLIQAFDEKEDYFFVKEVVFNDVEYLEEDTFELERIHNRFYKDLDLEQAKGSFNENDNHKSYVSSANFLKGDQTLHLKTVIKGGHYFLLGKLSKNKTIPTDFFNSFEIKSYDYKDNDYQIKKDTALYFSVKTVVKPPVYKPYNSYRRKKEEPYETFYKTLRYKSKTNEEIVVELRKKHDLVSYKNLDSMVNGIKKQIEKDKFFFNDFSYSNKSKLTKKNRLYVANTTYGKEAQGTSYINYLIKDSLSSRAIKVKNIIANGTIYELRTLIDTTYKTSAFVKEFYGSFTPKDTVIGKSLFTSKTDVFFKHLKNKDSIALDGYYHVNFDKKDTDKIIKVIKTYEFGEDQLKIKENLIEKLGKHKSKKVDAFFIDLYKKSYDNPQNQIVVFNYFSKQKNKKAYETLLDLLEADIPLSTESFEINKMFSSLKKDLDLSKSLFPDLLNYATINEYKKPIYNLLSLLLSKEKIKSKVYKSYKKQILNEAKIELKRELSKKGKSYRTYTKSLYNNESILKSYVTILHPFSSDKNTKEFLSKVKKANNIEANTTYLALQIKNNEILDKQLFTAMVNNINSKGLLYMKLKAIKKQNFFPEKEATKENIYKSFLFSTNDLKKTKDSITLIKVKNFELYNKRYEAYFYKSKAEPSTNSYRKKDWKLNVIAFERKNKEIFVDPVYTIKGETIDETKTIDEVINLNLEKILLFNRKRANVSSYDYQM